MYRKLLTAIFIILFASSASSTGIQLSQSDIVQIPTSLMNKLGSGYLQLEVSKKIKQQQQFAQHSAQAVDDCISIVIYSDRVFDERMQKDLLKAGCKVQMNSLTQPTGAHRLGFLLASIPAANIVDLMQLDFIKKIDLAEREFSPQSNVASATIEADYFWARGYSGSDVKIAILDAGLDAAHPDLPQTIEKKDYSNYPTLDDDITTFATGHGTHVTGIALGRGVLSAGNTGNGGGPYTGMAPAASLIFLKIGKDSDGTAKGTAIYNALEAAVQIYHADVINLSYGSWDTYHDGSHYLDQKIDDIVYNSDVPVIVAAGNLGAAKRHYSETVSAHSSSDFIQVNVVGASANSDLLKFNAVWYDGLDVHNQITVEYYDSDFNQLTDVRYLSQAESLRGTEHQVSYYNPYLPAGDHTYYVKIVNNSDNDQLVHLYEDDENWHVTFENADNRYTVCSPATADNAFAVGAVGNRESWVDYTGGQHSSYTSETLCSFSGRGPRVDEATKPQITAPGVAIISLRDGNVYTTPSTAWVDDDGASLGDPDGAHYMARTGTSMAAPVVTGAAALLLDEHPDYTADQVYTALTEYADTYQGVVPPDASWGYGVLDLDEDDDQYTPIGVNLIAFSAETQGDAVEVRWTTASEINHAGYNLQRATSENGDYQQINSELILAQNESGLEQTDYIFRDFPPAPGTYFYRLEQIDMNGEHTRFGPVSAMFSTKVRNNSSHFRFNLSQNYPNPFNPVTTINFEIEKTGKVKIAIYDLLGCKIKTLIDQELSPGVYSVLWNGQDEFERMMSSGVYIIQMTADDFSSQHRATLLR